MRAWVLLVGCCLWLTVSSATPVPIAAPEPPPAADRVARQNADPAQPVAAAPQEEDDDDDDDDDDDVDLDLGDDDDDDDDDDDTADDDDDDDDEDYFERFFDDILGDDDDDDDEDDEEVAAPAPAIVAAAPTVAPTVAPAQAAVPQPQEAASVVEETPQDYGTAPGEEDSLETEATNTVVLTTNDSDQEETANSVGSEDVEDDEAEDDDDEEEDEDDDDDDDDDDLVGDIEAKQARALKEADVAPPVYIVKYNRFVDTILDRINKILRKSYDPVNVRLQSSSEAKKNKHKKRKNKEKQSRVTETSRGNVTEEVTELMTEVTTLAAPTSTQAAEPRKKKNPTRATPTNNNKTKNKTKTKSGTPRAKATLYGLSSIQRDGDVTVNVMSSHTTVKTRFLVGPLVLKVEKEFGRGAKKELRSATATTAEMTGKLNLRVLNGGVATLHSIKVLQPRQVRVESPDDHDRTREFVWRRSSSIAKLVSEKLLAATKSMLQPPPAAKPTA